MHSFYFFFCLQLVYLISVCLDCLLSWASCCDQNLIILGNVVALCIGKGQWSITASSCDAEQITKALITSLLCTCTASAGWLGVTLLVMRMDFFHSYSLCCYWTWAVVFLYKVEIREDCIHLCGSCMPSVAQMLQFMFPACDCASHMHTLLWVWAPKRESSHKHLTFYELYSTS